MQTAQQESVRDLTVSDLTRKGACLAFFTAYDDLDTARMIGLAAPNATVHFLPLGEGGKGSFWEFGKVVWDLLIDCFPDIDNTLDAAIAQDEQTVRCQVVIRGTQAKDFAGITCKGKHFDSDHIFIFRLNEAGKIDYIQVEWDHADFQRQLGS